MVILHIQAWPKHLTTCLSAMQMMEDLLLLLDPKGPFAAQREMFKFSVYI